MTRFAALTLPQPYASLIAIGAKPIECRAWEMPTRYIGERVAIHAAARPVRMEDVNALLLELRHARGDSEGLRPELAVELLEGVRANPFSLPLAAVVCTVTFNASRWSDGRWEWPLADVELVQPPVSARGGGLRSFWYVEIPDAEFALG